MSDETIAPTELRDLMKSLGWVLVEEARRDRLYAFDNPEFPRRQLIFPMDAHAPDYAESVDNVFEKLAHLTGQAAPALRARAQFVKDDVLRLRVHAHGGDDRVLPLSFATALVENTAKMLRAAACTVLRPRAHHPRLALSEATQLVERARFGHTEGGSFVVRVACPIHAVEGQGTLPESEPGPFVRQVTVSLQRALARLTEAIEADRVGALVDEMKRASAPLLSANLCEAVSGMHDESMGNSLDIGFDWSALQPIHDASLRRPVRIQRDYFARIEEVRRELRAVERPEDGPFIGTVERLGGELNVDGQRSGEVVLSLLLPDEGETVTARMMLSAVDYKKADRAHMTNNAYVRVMGRLRPGRQPRQLTDVTLFELVTSSNNAG